MSDPTTADLVSRLVARHNGAAQVARLLGGDVTARTVLRHASGERTPAPGLLAKYSELDARAVEAPPAPDRAVGGFAAVCTDPPAPTAPSPPAFDPTRPTLDAVVELAQRAHANLAAAISDPDASHRDRAGAVHAYSRSLQQLATLRGELEPSEASILRSPAWVRMWRAIEEALAPFPDAQRAAAEALVSLETREASS